MRSAVGISGLQAGEDVKEYIIIVNIGVHFVKIFHVFHVVVRRYK